MDNEYVSALKTEQILFLGLGHYISMVFFHITQQRKVKIYSVFFKRFNCYRLFAFRRIFWWADVLSSRIIYINCERLNR